MILNELNLKSTDQVTRHQFPNYILETDDLDIVDQIARTGVLIHVDLQYKRRRDLETMGTSVVWIQISTPGKKSILLQSIYRQFQRLGRPGTISPSSQQARWSKIVDKWVIASAEDREIISMGDLESELLSMETYTPANEFLRSSKKTYDRRTY